MATFYLDFEGGNDANDGTTFANRWKTLTSGATAARIAPGDIIRVMGSPDPTLVGNATWTQYSKSIVLASAVTANISDCETLWTASTNVTTSTNASNFKENTKAMNVAVAAAFTTGKAAFFATGTLDLSAYQQVSFWVQNNTAVTAGTLSLRLCSDTAGATPVHTIAIPAIPSINQWVPVTVDLGANMNSAIQSIALYQDVDIAAVTLIIDNIIACKASSSADSLTLTSLIGKVCNLSWVASTAYSLNDERKPTQTNRNGYRYKVTVAGTTGSTEPAWPEEVGMTVTDGTVTWSCTGLEDTWYPIQSINGTTVKLDGPTSTAGSGGRGYSGTTETVPTYKREAIRGTPASTSGAVLQSVQDSGSFGSQISFRGGWDRTSMSAMTGETWVDGGNGFGTAYDGSNRNYLTLENLNSVRTSIGLNIQALSGCIVKNCHQIGNGTYGIFAGTTNNTGGPSQLMGVATNNNTYGLVVNNPLSTLKAVTASGNDRGIWQNAGSLSFDNARDITVKNNTQFGLLSTGTTVGVIKVTNLISANNPSTGVSLPYDALLINSSVTDTTPLGTPTALTDRYVWCQKWGQAADSHYGFTDGGSIVSATDQRHTASGIAWKFRPTSSVRNSFYPLRLSVAKIACTANSPVSLTIWCRRDNTNIKGQLFLAGGQVAGVPSDLAIDCQPTVNTWVQSSTLTFTPTENGVVEIVFKCWDGVGTANNMWIDDLSIS